MSFIFGDVIRESIFILEVAHQGLKKKGINIGFFLEMKLTNWTENQHFQIIESIGQRYFCITSTHPIVMKKTTRIK
jgi:hypothetical protein